MGLSFEKRKDLRFVKGTVLVAIYLVVCISSVQNPVPMAFAFASGNQVIVKNRFFRDRSIVGKLSSPLFSTEPASNSPPTTAVNGEPIGKVLNGASSNEASSDESEIEIPMTLLERFRQVSNLASFLCLLDCTLLPLVTVVLPLMGILNFGAGQLRAFEKLGHTIALSFVLPIGSLTTVVNYLSHKKKPIAAMAFFGLAMVGIANSHFHVHHWPAIGPVSLGWIGGVLHQIQGCGSYWHRVVNVSGCALLLGSNYWSQQQDVDCCAHNHDH